MASAKQRYRRRAIRAVIQECSADDSFDGLSEREIAFITGISKSAINRQIARGCGNGQFEVAHGERRSVRLKSGQAPHNGQHDK